MLLKYVCGCHLIRPIVIKRNTVLVLSIRSLYSRNKCSKSDLCSIWLFENISSRIRTTSMCIVIGHEKPTAITIRNRNLIVVLTRLFYKERFFPNLIKGTREVRGESTIVTSEIFSFPLFRVSRCACCTCYMCLSEKKYVRHKERWKKKQRAPDIRNRQREIVWHHSSLFIIGHRHRVHQYAQSFHGILTRHQCRLL